MSLPDCILLTGAAGYIASHTWLALQEAGYTVVGVDSFVNSSPVALDRLREIGGQPIHFVQGDVRDRSVLDRFAQTLNANPNTEVRIIGHTDSTGSDAINNPLSVNRAQSARDYLVARGVSSSRIRPISRS